MYTAYRLNDPDEIMPPHKHTPSAVRFGLTGKGNFTGVAGEDIVFGPGDMVLTPNDTWHNHGTVGGEPAVNLSVLDLPLVETLCAIQFDHNYSEMVDGEKVAKKTQTAIYSPTTLRESTVRAVYCRDLPITIAAPGCLHPCMSTAGNAWRNCWSATRISTAILTKR